MRITWYGHAAFAVEGSPSNGTTADGDTVKVILDPYNYPGCGGYLPVDDSADVVTVSHDNQRYHSDVSTIRGEPVILEALEIVGTSRTIQGVEFSALEVYEDREGNGPNAMVKFTLDGLRVAHQGDLGHPLEGAALEFLKGVDILLALAGGPPTIEVPDLVRHVVATRPKLVFPMHYKTPKVNLNILPVDAFVDAFLDAYRELDGDVEVSRPGTSVHEVTRESLPEETTVVVLDHAR